jgi:hypothetical protein
LFVTEVCVKEIWVVFSDERVRSLRVPKLELPLRTGMESGASGIGYDPFLLHSQITQPSLVYDPRNDIWRVHWWNEILEVPTVTITENGVRKKSEGDESVQQSEQNGQPVVEDDDWDGEKSYSTVVVTLDGERRQHVDERRKGREGVDDCGRGQRAEGLSGEDARVSLYTDVVKAKRCAISPAAGTAILLASADHRCKRVSCSPHLMALLLTIFLLVLLSQLISWIGTSVLQEFVRQSLISVPHN